MSQRLKGHVKQVLDYLDKVYPTTNDGERYKYNMKVIDTLKQYCEMHRDVRFTQALVNLNIVDIPKEQYNIESKTTHQRSHKSFKKLIKSNS